MSRRDGMVNLLQTPDNAANGCLKEYPGGEIFHFEWGSNQTQLLENGNEMGLKFIVFIIVLFGCAYLMPTASMAEHRQEIRRDGRLIAYDNGVVEDIETGLEWVAGPDKDTSYYAARNWVQQLRVDGGRWRMPTVQELQTLYGKKGDLSNISPLLRTTGTHVWSAQHEEDISLYLFRYMDPFGTRGFAVRSK